MMAAETTNCSNCGQANPAGMRFCGHCGAALASVTQTLEGAATTTAGSTSDPTLTLETSSAGIAAAEPPSTGSSPSPNPASAAPVPTLAAATLAVPTLAVPTDPIARERERDRLLSLASVQRMRAQILDARSTLLQAIVISEGMPGPQVAPIHEMLGDLLAAEERWEQAASAYEQAQLRDPTRASAERKFGEMTLRISDEKAMAALGGGAVPGTDAITSGSKAKRNPGFAMILSLIGPGFGQFYNGQFVKGCLCLGVFVVAVFFITLTSDGQTLRCVFLPASEGCRGLSVSPVSWVCLLAAVGAWLFSLIDAPVAASKTEDTLGDGGPAIDKSGWEV
ncbi:MAG: zinc ribbon domain-containing protein [Cytophagales bacterium]|nr:zinc ribbon domain-containing protein [Armatimonadota bacterium]